MKKLMFAAVAMAAGVCLADITSNNVVGYQQKDLDTTGFTAVIPTFEKVDGSDMKLKDVQGNFVDFESIQFMNKDFGTDREYLYLTTGFGVEKDGWYDGEMKSADDVVIPAGAGIVFASQGTDTMQFSGEVPAKAISTTASAEGFTLVGNCSPVDLKLSQITFTGVADFDSVQFMDPNAATAAEYLYLTTGFGVEKDGWYDGEMKSADDVVIPAGGGFVFSAANGTAVTITIPSAL